MAPGIPYSDAIPINETNGAPVVDRIVPLIANPDPSSYPAIFHFDLTFGANVTQCAVGFVKGAGFLPVWDAPHGHQMSDAIQAPTDTTWVGAGVGIRISFNNPGTAGTQLVIHGEFRR